MEAANPIACSGDQCAGQLGSNIEIWWGVVWKYLYYVDLSDDDLILQAAGSPYD